MNSFVRHIQNEDGVVLILALFVLILLTVVGISATNTSTIDLQISANDKAYKISFYNADSGVYTTPKLISRTIDANVPITGLNNIDYLVDASGALFFDQVMGYTDYDTNTPPQDQTDIEYTLGGNTVKIDINRTGQESLVGGGAEFAAGAEGVAGGASVAVYFDMNSFGSGPNNASTNEGAVYRKVVGVPGGL
jgi:hypothetical protein